MMLAPEVRLIAPTTQPARLAAPPRGEVDTGLVPGLTLPKIDGLPGPTTPGSSYSRIPAPPKAGSPAFAADLAAVHAAQRLRTPEGDAWARKMDATGATKIWFDLAARVRERTGRVQGWLNTALLAAVIGANAVVTAVAKNKFDRPRPFQVDPSIIPPFKLPSSDAYPSGHASSAFAAARVIATLEPKLAIEAYSLATQVAVSRVYAGVHFPSDVVVGALLGTSVADATLKSLHRK